MAWSPAGATVSAFLTIYFAVAISFHIRVGDTAHPPTPLLMLVLATAVLALHLAA